MNTRLAAGAWILIAGLAQGQTNAQGASAEAASYLEAALDEIEKGSRVYTTDWKALRVKALATIASAKAETPTDTYPAIREALAALGDKYGLMLDPAAAKIFNLPRATKGTGLLVVPPDPTVANIVPGSPAAAAGLALGDRIVGVEGLTGFGELSRREFDRLFKSGLRLDGSAAPLALSVRTGSAKRRAVELPLASFDEYLPPLGRRLDGDIGYLELPSVSSGPKATIYAETVHQLLGEFDDGALRGFIVDLRRTTGGSLWPLLASMGPLLGNGKAGAFVSAMGGADWGYNEELGAAVSEGYELLKVSEPFPVRDDLPVAVLTSPLTASFGEAIAVGFAGRAATRRFGESTRGVTYSSTQIELADGAQLILTVTVMADRTGKRYAESIPPEEPIATDWTRFGTADDPVLAAASRWLASAAGAK
jgi:C-terminal processing protease CtpA/Prc